MNDDASPPTITVEINGKTAQANLPTAGGNGWEKLDINDLPTDFSVDDLIIFVLKNIRPELTSNPASWDTAPSEPPSTNPTGSYLSTILLTGHGDLNFSLGVRSIEVISGGSRNVRYVIISNGSFYDSCIDRLNSKSGNILYIETTCFNGGGATKSTFYVTYDNIPSRIEAMYRCKTN